MAPYINNHNLKNLHKSLKIRQFRLNIILSRKYKSGCLKLFCFWLFQRCSGYFWLFQGFSYMFLVVSRVFWLFLVISKFLLYVSYMFKGCSGCFKVSPICSYMFFLIKLFLVVSGSLNCFWLFLYISYMFIFEYSVFRHFWAFLGGFMTSMVFLYLSIYLKGLKGI